MEGRVLTDNERVRLMESVDRKLESDGNPGNFYLALIEAAYDKAVEDCAQACLTIYAPGALMCADKCWELTHAD